LPYYTLSPTYSVCADHGYLAGDAHECPKCGKKTETYSRITGYYRPVQNWNDGKAQEFKDRRLYEIEKSVLNPKERHNEEKTVTEQTPSEAPTGLRFEPKKTSKAMLFTTKTCPNCKMARHILDSNNVLYDVIDAEEHAATCKQYNVSQAPTLVIVEDERVSTISSISSIKQFVKG
jgi:ribonucleoside-triphosphate reductase